MDEVRILTFSDLFNKIISKEAIIDRIKRLKTESSLATISYLITNRKSEPFNDYINEIYISQKSVLLAFESVKKIRSKNTVLFSLQGLLYLTKYIYAYNNMSDVDYNQKNEITYDKYEIRKIIDLQLMLSDYIQTEISDVALLKYNMIKFNLRYNIKSLMSRTWCIFTDIAVSKDIFNKHENVYTDFNQKFFETYEYTIIEYLVVYFYLFSPFFQETISKGIIIDTDHHFDSSRNPDICNKIARELLCHIDDYCEYSIKTIDNSWNYEILTKLPILQISPTKSTVISDQHLQENVVENLIEKIRKTYEKKQENDFKQFLGYPFEEYIQKLSLSCTTNSKYGYKFKDEFPIRKNVMSSDAYIYKDSNMLIVEVKAKTLTRSKLFIEYNSDNMKCKIKEQFIRPTQQIDDRCEDIKNSKKHSYLFDNIQEIYSIIVNFESCHLSVSDYHKYAINGINSEDEKGNMHIRTKQMKYFFSFGIEEFECLCWLIENRSDIFDILKKYYPYSNDYYFYNFLNKENIYFEVVPRMVNDNWEYTKRSFYNFFQISE